MSYQLLTAKTETVLNTEILNAAADTCFVENVQFKTLGERVVLNPAKPSLAANPGKVTGQHSEITFDFLLSGSGAAGTAPKHGKFLTAAGFAEAVTAGTTVTYSRLADPDASKSLTMVWRDQNRLHKLLGARGRIGFKAVAGQPLRASAVFRGLLVPVAASAPLVPADANFGGWEENDAIAQGRTTFTLGGTTLTLRELSGDAADNVKFIDLPNQKGVFLRGDASMSGKLQANVPAVGTFSPEAKWLSQEKLAWSLVHGTTAGNIVTLNGLIQVGEPSYSRVDEFDVFDQSAFFVGSGLQTNDDFSIVLT